VLSNLPAADGVAAIMKRGWSRTLGRSRDFFEAVGCRSIVRDGVDYDT